MGDLHAEITAKLNELEKLTRAVLDDPLDWETTVWGSPHEARLDRATGGPKGVLRGLAEDRDILRRHYDVMNAFHDSPCCAACNTDEGAAVLWPCDDIKSLARRHGVEVPHAG